MAGGQERALRRRIKSVQSTKKITKAMELIAASRIAKAQARVAAARPYADKITDVIRNLAAGGASFESKLLVPADQVDTVCFVVVTADRGLAGAYNSSIIRKVEKAMIAEQRAGRETRLITVGKKALSYFKFRGYDIEASYLGFSETPSYDDAKMVATHVLEHFEAGDYQQVRLGYTQFLTASSQTADIVAYMPLELDDVHRADGGPSADYEYEPDPTEILERLLPRYAEAKLFAALLDGAASEQAARQRAMKSATDNAEELIVKLSRQMNRARQDAITTEISEIVSGAEAMRAARGGDPNDLFPDLDPTVLFPDLLEPLERALQISRSTGEHQ